MASACSSTDRLRPAFYVAVPLTSITFNSKTMRKRNHSIETDNLVTALSSSSEFSSQHKRLSIEDLRLSPLHFGTVITAGGGAGIFRKIIAASSAKLQRDLHIRARFCEHNAFLVQLHAILPLQNSTALFFFRKYEYGSLHDVLQHNEPCPVNLNQLMKIIFSLATAIDFLHSKELTHGFLTTKHCVVDEFGFVRLCGLNNLHQGSRANASRWSDYSDTEYLSPEATADGRSVTVDPFLVDMFAIGVILHRCLYGKFPAASPVADDVIFVFGHPPIVSEKSSAAKANISAIQKVIRRLLNANPSIRLRAGALLHLSWLRDAAAHGRAGQLFSLANALYF